MHRKYIVYLLFINFLLCTNSLASFSQGSIKLYNAGNGLPSSTVYSSMQDKEGFIWFATNAGVSRFDGKQFENFDITDGLSDNEVLHIAQDSKDRIWFLCFNGTVSYYLNGRFYNSTNDTVLTQAHSNNSFTRFFNAANGDIWLTSFADYIRISGMNVKKFSVQNMKLYNDGIVMNNNDSSGVLIIPYSTNGKANLYEIKNYKDAVTKLKLRYTKIISSDYAVLKNGNILFASDSGIVLQRDTVQKLILPFRIDEGKVNPSGILLSSTNKLWVATNGAGVFVYDYSNLSLPPAHILKGAFAGRLFEDHERNVWINSFIGAYMIPSWYFNVKIYDTSNGLSDNNIHAIAAGSHGLTVGQNLAHTDIISKDSVIQLNINFNATKYNRITRILVEGENTWIASDRGLIHYNPVTHCNHLVYRGDRDHSVPIMPIKDISVVNDELYIATSFNLYSHSTLNCRSSFKQEFSSVYLRHYSVYANKQGIWAGTGKGLYGYRVNDFKDLSKEDKLLTARVEDIAELPDSALVLATYGYGLVIYKHDKVLQNFTVADGLPSNTCKRLYILDNDIYVATQKGAAKLSYKSGDARLVSLYTTSNALPSNDVNDICADRYNVYIATGEGLVSIKHSYKQLNTSIVPILRITGFWVAKKRLPITNSNQLRYSDNSIRIDYIGISYQSSADVVYQYRLNNNQHWTETKNTSLEFPFLKPDNYTFQLRTRVTGGQWSTVRSIYFVITPPFWRTTWFLASAVILFLIIVFSVVKFRLRNLKRKKDAELRIKNQLARLEQHALQAMMNPHFIFNVMNSIQQFINVNDPAAANKYLSDFAKLIRMNLDISAKSVITLNEELEYLKLYLELESLRFSPKFIYEFEIEQGIDTEDTFIPVMILQPFVENAILHGILPLKQAGYLQIAISTASEELLKIRIIDNGIGIETSSRGKTGKVTHVSRGMALTQQRIDLLAKMTGSELYIHVLNRMSQDGSRGTIVEIVLPDDLAP